MEDLFSFGYSRRPIRYSSYFIHENSLNYVEVTNEGTLLTWEGVYCRFVYLRICLLGLIDRTIRILDKTVKIDYL